MNFILSEGGLIDYLHPEVIGIALKKKGYTIQWEDEKRTAWNKEDGGSQLIIPKDTKFHDYGYRIENLITDLAEYERTSPFWALHELIRCGFNKGWSTTSKIVQSCIR